MASSDNDQFKAVWNQRKISVILRRDNGSIRIRKLPYRVSDAPWLRRNGRGKAVYNERDQYWDAPKAWFNRLVKQFVEELGSVYIIQPIKAQQVCAPACWNARGHQCECSCLGENHGSNNDENGWFVVSDVFASKWDDVGFACRLLVRSGDATRPHSL